MMTALNVAYDVEDHRPWWKRRLVAIGLTFALALLILSAMTLLVFGGAIGKLLDDFIGLGPVAVTVWNVAQWPLAVFFVVLGIALVYFVAPAVEQRTWDWVTPGSLVATVAWLAMSLGLRAYVTYFGNYGATYGSIAGVILLMLWLYLSGLVLLFGAEINSEIEHAAAEQGAPTAKAEGERAPGVAGLPHRAQVRVAAQEEARQSALRQGAASDGPARERTPAAGAATAVTAAELDAVAQQTTEGVARMASGVAHGLRALPWVAAWAGLRVVSRTTGALSRGRIERAARAERAAAAVATERLERARAAERARHQLPPVREAG